MDRNKIACECNNVTYGMIADAVAAGERTFDAVQQRTGCGTCCGDCIDFITHLVAQLAAEQPTE